MVKIRQKLLRLLSSRASLGKLLVTSVLGVLVVVATHEFSSALAKLDRLKDSSKQANNWIGSDFEGFIRTSVFLSQECPRLDPARVGLGPQLEIFDAVDSAAAENDLDRLLLFSVIIAESRCNPRARSRAGAMGLMQLMPATASWLGVQSPFSVEDNVRGGAKYLAYLIQRYDGNLSLALAAYNAGPATVASYGGVPPFTETRRFVRQVLGYYQDLTSFIANGDEELAA